MIRAEGMTAPRHILVVVTRRIGDVLLATPLIRSLKKAWPGARIEVLVFAGTDGVLSGNPDIHQILTVAQRPGLGTHLALLSRLYKRYDLALSLVTSDRSTLYAALAGRRSLGLLLDEPGQRWKQRLLDRWLPLEPRQMHTVRAHLALALALGIPAAAEVVPAWRPQDADAVAALLGDDCRPLAILHPYPKFHYKLWHQAGWITTAQWFLDQGFRVVLTGSPDPEEKEYVGTLARALPEALDLSGRLNLGGTAALLARARFYVGPDTAITHLAAATGLPTIALFGPSDPVKWGPWPKGHAAETNPWQRLGDQRRGNVQLIQGRASCVPCLLEGCERRLDSGSDCLLAIPSAVVIQKIKTLAAAGLA